MKIRYQSNGIPANCYRTQSDTRLYPTTQDIDFTVVWNRPVFGTYNAGYEYYPDGLGQESEFFQNKLCDKGILITGNMPTGTYFQSLSGTTSLEYVAGFTISNSAILPAINLSGKDSF